MLYWPQKAGRTEGRAAQSRGRAGFSRPSGGKNGGASRRVMAETYKAVLGALAVCYGFGRASDAASAAVPLPVI